MPEKDGFRLLHTMLRVKDLDKTLDFFTRLLGMDLLRKAEFPGGKFTLVFFGYGDEESHTVIELTHNWDQQNPTTWAPGCHRCGRCPCRMRLACESGGRNCPPRGAHETRHPGDCLRQGSRRLYD